MENSIDVSKKFKIELPYDPATGVGNGNPIQYSYLENSMDWEAWQNTVHGVTKSQTQLSTHTWPSSFTSVCTSEGNENRMLRYLHPHTYYSIIHNHQGMETT